MTSVAPDLLLHLPPDQAEQIMAMGKHIDVPSGEELFALGAHADSIFIIERGRIRLTLPMHVRGKQEDVLVEERLPGQTVGWSALIPPHRFTLKATAPLDTGVIAFSREDLNRFLIANPATGHTVALNLAAVIGQRLQIFQAMWLREIQRVVELSCA